MTWLELLGRFLRYAVIIYLAALVYLLVSEGEYAGASVIALAIVFDMITLAVDECEDRIVRRIQQLEHTIEMWR